MPVRSLPSNPNLEHLKHQAKDLIKGHTARDRSIAQRLREFHPQFRTATDNEIFAAPLSLSAAQLALAREYGYPSWARLKAHVEQSFPTDPLQLPHHERIEDQDFRRAVALLDCGDEAGLRAHLKQHPRLSHDRVVFEGGNYFRNPTLLEFVAENPVRHGKLPGNIVAIAEIILDAGVPSSALDETLGLVCSGRVVRECGVQIALIDLLCTRGADPNGALQAAIGHGEFQAAHALLARGGRLTLPVAAALGNTDDARRLLRGSSLEDRHRALALASQFGHVEIVRMLLDAGQDPNRYNPLGCHSHSTPLHQAAFAGHESVVRLLIERGAELDLKDVLWKGTPADWAAHAGNQKIEAILREHQSQKVKQE